MQSAIERIKEDNPGILRYSEVLGDKIQTANGWHKYLRALYINCLLTHEPFYYYLLASSNYQALSRGVDLDNLEIPPIPDKAKPLSISEAKIKIADEKLSGITTGFWHGHLRILTPGSMIAGVIASEGCDSLTVGIEEGWRTERYKNALLFYEDQTRALALLSSGIAANVVVIGRETEYSDQGYADLLHTLSPDKYFVSISNYEADEQTRFRQRIKGTTIMLVEIPKIPSFSTTYYIETLRGKTEANPNFLP